MTIVEKILTRNSGCIEDSGLAKNIREAFGPVRFAIRSKSGGCDMCDEEVTIRGPIVEVLPLRAWDPDFWLLADKSS
ncbi:hypothetical protein CC2G_010778 [Coprinopsis cinerea AmutBmut pab1-1]|nr:hypothetical protein CC2G_010778 [Coprinopsis cinerea AmutBmut pab1-1]